MSAPLCTDVGGAYGGRWASDGVRVTRQTHVHDHLVGFRGVCRVSLGGGVNGHDVNLRDKCGVYGSREGQHLALCVLRFALRVLRCFCVLRFARWAWGAGHNTTCLSVLWWPDMASKVEAITRSVFLSRKLFVLT